MQNKELFLLCKRLLFFHIRYLNICIYWYYIFTACRLLFKITAYPYNHNTHSTDAMNGASETESTFKNGETAGAENNWTDDDIELLLTVCVVMVVLLASTLFLLGRSRRNITNRNNSNNGHRMRQVHDEHNMMGFVGGGRIQVNTSVEGIAGFKEEGKNPEFARIGMKVVSAICSRLHVSESRVGKGTVVVVSFTPRDLMNKPDCSVGLVKALACCYNLVCVLRLPDETTSSKTMSKDDQAVIDDIIRTFRSYGITEEMIGSHKILACRSVS